MVAPARPRLLLEGSAGRLRDPGPHQRLRGLRVRHPPRRGPAERRGLARDLSAGVPGPSATRAPASWPWSGSRSRRSSGLAACCSPSTRRSWSRGVVALLCLHRAPPRNGSDLAWLGAGLAVGLGLLAKYTMLFVLPGVLLYAWRGSRGAPAAPPPGGVGRRRARPGRSRCPSRLEPRPRLGVGAPRREPGAGRGIRVGRAARFLPGLPAPAADQSRRPPRLGAVGGHPRGTRPAARALPLPHRLCGADPRPLRPRVAAGQGAGELGGRRLPPAVVIALREPCSSAGQGSARRGGGSRRGCSSARRRARWASPPASAT